MKLIIIRGPSGSGKSTIARHLGGVDGINHFEADMFFMRNGVYQFDLTRLGDAHGWCSSMVKHALADPKNKKDVIVSNTTTTLKELNVYVGIANALDVPYEIIRTPEPWDAEKLFVRNTHRVPKETLVRQIKRYEPHDEENEWRKLEIFHE